MKTGRCFIMVIPEQVTQSFDVFNGNYHEKTRSRSTMCPAEGERDLDFMQ